MSGGGQLDYKYYAISELHNLVENLVRVCRNEVRVVGVWFRKWRRVVFMGHECHQPPPCTCVIHCYMDIIVAYE